MKTKALTVLTCVLLLWSACTPDNSNHSGPAPESDGIEARVDSILATLTLEDKVGEMTQLTLDMVLVGPPYAAEEPQRFDEELLRKVIVDLKVGSILNCAGHTLPRATWHTFIGEMQRLATEEKSSGVPVLYGIDAIHGVNYTDSATLFPQQIALAATWNPDLALEMGGIVAYETRASGIPWNFSPVLDLGRDFRWPRLWESFGEDVLLASEMGEALMRGYQGDDVGDPEHVAACLKHFLGYSTPITGKDRTQCWIPERQLREYFLPSFQRSIEAGAKTIMVNSGEINGIPVHANPKILTELLRNELGFEGVVVTDWEDIKYLRDRHKVAADYKEAIVLAVNAGIDLSMVPVDYEFPVLLKELVEEGRISEARIDESVRRLLRLKLELGLFEQPIVPMSEYPNFKSEAHRLSSYKAASEAITLLQNDGVLPLQNGQKVFVTGPTAFSLNDLNGGWTHTWQGVDPSFNTPGKRTIAEAMVAAGMDVTAAELSHDASSNDIMEAFSRSLRSDVIVLCLGETPYTETVGDIEDLQLAANQREMIAVAERTGKPVVIVLVEGRPRTAPEMATAANAVLTAYLPGNEGGPAIADVLNGTVNPSGKLPYTYPRHPSASTTYDHKYTDMIDPQFGWNAVNPLYPFGHGLSYTTFAYDNLRLEADSLGGGDTLRVAVDIKNTGDRDGMEVVQVFVADSVASIAPSVKRLRAFKKVSLEAGQAAMVSFEIPVSDLAFVGLENRWVVEPGRFGLSIDTLAVPFDVGELTFP